MDSLSVATRRIRSTTSTALASAPAPCVRSSAIPAPVPSIYLPIPRDISPLLVNRGCPSDTAQSLSDAFLRSANHIAHVHRTTHHNAHAKLTRTLAADPACLAARTQKLALYIEQEYSDRIRAAELFAFDRVTSLHSSESKPLPVKATFNQDFVPLLEKYFEYNAYPSPLDRAGLAKKSLMTPRQIEVWFQNHRNRARKEGKTLKKMPLDRVPPEFSLKSLESKMPLFIFPEPERVDPALVNIKPEETPQALKSSTPPRDKAPTSEFTLDAPPHAFPARYPSTCDYDPFPVKLGPISFTAPTWVRKPATSRSPCPPVAIDDLIRDFSRLYIYSSTSTGQHRDPHTKPWFASTHTTPPQAPHPALVCPRIPRVQIPAPALTPFPVTPAPAYRLRPFQAPTPGAPLLTLASAATATTARKIVLFSRRAPSQNKPSESRTSSFGSDISSSSSASDASSPVTYDTSFDSDVSSSTLATPEPVSTPLPADTSVNSGDCRGLRRCRSEEEECDQPTKRRRLEAGILCGAV